MINEILNNGVMGTSAAPVLTALGIRKNIESEKIESLKKELVNFKVSFTDIGDISVGDKIGKSDDKYYLFKNGWFQKAWRLGYRENREWTFKYLDDDFTKFMQFLDKIVLQFENATSLESNALVKDVTAFIDIIMPGLYNLKKTYPAEVKLVAKIDSIIITLIDFKDKTRSAASIIRERAKSFD